MGETRPVLTISDDKLSGYFLLSNVCYPISGARLETVSVGIAAVMPEHVTQLANLLGREAALWAEHIAAPELDIKLWPRAFVVAERLWSAQNVNEGENMYTRLQAVDSWSTVSVGLQYTQQLTQFTRLANNADTVPLQMLAQALEPAHYYTHQHLKFQAGNYHQFAPP